MLYEYKYINYINHNVLVTIIEGFKSKLGSFTIFLYILYFKLFFSLDVFRMEIDLF